MKPPQVLNYHGPSAAKKPPLRWSQDTRFLVAVILAFIAMAASLLGSWGLYESFTVPNTGPDSFENTTEMLVLVESPIWLLLLSVWAVTIGLSVAKRNPQWCRGQLLAVFLPQTAAVVLPSVIILFYGHRL